MTVTLGTPGRIMPPASKAVEFAQQAEADGFDAVWWPCHLMGWLPDSVWNEEFTPLAETQASPHVYFDPLTMMGAAGAATERLRVGVCVTDVIRRHPAMLAQQALTVDHLAGGRAILGLGSGERMNVAPYGIEWRKPVSRLAEGIDVIRTLWESEGKPVDFHGDFFSLEGGVLGLEPYEGTPPPIWLAAHGPRMLDLCGRRADGWIPTNVTPEEYAAKLAGIRESAEGAGRDPDAITPSMLAYVLCAPDEETLERLCENPMTRLLFAAVSVSPETYARYGTTAPFEGGSGFHSYVPALVSREEALRVASHIPNGIVKDSTLHGTPEQIADRIRAFADAGLRDVILWNITAFADPKLAGYSFRAMKRVKELLASVEAR
ncbi:MAG: class flavin-dependent oxidoreductase [Solirubrobacterales bacterium]|nr:class flavin-dependent oxidoreductase [Solirubrobacterales bacterium]